MISNFVIMKGVCYQNENTQHYFLDSETEVEI